MLKPIKTRKDHKAALARIDALMDARAGTPEAAELEVLAILVERYEAQAFPIRLPTPLDAIEFAMEQHGYTQADLGRVLSSRSRASELLKGKRPSVAQIRRLHQAWKIPTDALIGEAA
jgi:HTH-type transcriptional regulator/antitoxin HigA